MNVVFAGSFDPVTKGHINIIKRLSKKFQKVFVVIGKNPDKTCYFSVNERKALLQLALKNVENACIYEFIDQKSYKEFLIKNNVNFYARGIRNQEDLIYEKKREDFNDKTYNIKTIYYKADKRLKDLSSKRIRENILNGKPIEKFLVKSTVKSINKFILDRK